MTGKERKQAEQARAAARLQKQAAYLQKNKAWNWVWPGGSDHFDEELPRNCWFTGLAPRNPNSISPDGNELLGTQPYFGPSKRTLKRRKARRGLRTTEHSMLAATRVVGGGGGDVTSKSQ